MPYYEAYETILTEPLAFDRSERFKDQDGHLHVRSTNLSKACVNPYRGREIPGYEKLGLNPDQIYQLFRDPVELEKAAPTFNNLRLMSRHVVVSATDPQEGLVAGSTGSEARFQAPYLVNSLVIWRQEDIDDVESRDKCELSAGYYYEPDMTPGTYDGLRYDGIMRNIRANHIALVEAGRAGPDVMVHDAKESHMPLASRKALIVKGALTAYMKPRLMPGTVLALDSVLGSVNGANWKTQKPIVLAAVTQMASSRLAMDASLADLPAFIGALDEEEDDKEADDEMMEDKKAKDKMPVPGKDRKALDMKLGRKASDKEFEDWAKEEEDEPEHSDDKKAKDKKAKDEKEEEDEDEKKEAKDKRAKDKAMDRAAMDEAIGAAEQRVIARMTAAAEAREIVRPYVGTVSLALDSAAAIYEFTLKSHKINTAEIHPSAFREMVKMLPRPGQPQPRERPAFDSAEGGGLESMFPSIARISHS